jgi:CBS domain-containing protein
MLDAKALRVVVVDGQGRPVGIVSSLDVLAAVVEARRPLGTENVPPGRAGGPARAIPDMLTLARPKT